MDGTICLQKTRRGLPLTAAICHSWSAGELQKWAWILVSVYYDMNNFQGAQIQHHMIPLRMPGYQKVDFVLQEIAGQSCIPCLLFRLLYWTYWMRKQCESSFIAAFRSDNIWKELDWGKNVIFQLKGATNHVHLEASLLIRSKMRLAIGYFRIRILFQ